MLNGVGRRRSSSTTGRPCGATLEFPWIDSTTVRSRPWVALSRSAPNHGVGGRSVDRPDSRAPRSGFDGWLTRAKDSMPTRGARLARGAAGATRCALVGSWGGVLPPGCITQPVVINKVIPRGHLTVKERTRAKGPCL